ncbi:MAG: hypothetical protein H7330_13905 [Hymenobacteraceae bacterium]|nr:hypothetical protein [Hymenobacteraceae bacterium]
MNRAFAPAARCLFLLSSLWLTACAEAPKHEAAALPPPTDQAAATVSSPAATDTTKVPDTLAEASAGQLIDQLLDDYAQYVAEYAQLAKQPKRNGPAAVRFDLLRKRAADTYTGLLDAMENHPFTPQQRERLRAIRARLDPRP